MTIDVKFSKALARPSFSKAFDYKDEANWVAMLAFAHDHAWRPWNRYKDDKP